MVSSIEGSVQIVLADGSSRPLQKGEILQPGAKLNIADDAKLELAPYDDSPAAATPDAPLMTHQPLVNLKPLMRVLRLLLISLHCKNQFCKG
ncbi:hypothetical protein [Aeromonas hydrophila]|uniref:hypothetical protein n=1 Tax=Aeromonas hydrophila TaxID=644 RepID=UPI001D0E28F8|nr:hypothetical protein [Aeromonas hydrophila]